jgi:hypothetical protein
VRPEEALAAARAAAAAARRERGGDAELPGLEVRPTDRVPIDRLMEWAVIEPDPDLLRSTRRFGAPVTWLKRLVLHVLRQYTRELESQQTRFNLHVALRLAELEERAERERPPGP